MGRMNLNWTLKDFDLVNVEFLVDDADLEVDVVREGEFQWRRVKPPWWHMTTTTRTHTKESEVPSQGMSQWMDWSVVASEWVCNIPDFQLLSGSHTMAFNAVTLHSTSLLVITLHRSKPFIGSPFQEHENQLCLVLGSMINPTNQPKTFQCIMSSLTHFSRNFSKGHPSHNYFKTNTLNYEVLKWWTIEKYMHLVCICSTN